MLDPDHERASINYYNQETVAQDTHTHIYIYIYTHIYTGEYIYTANVRVFAN